MLQRSTLPIETLSGTKDLAADFLDGDRILAPFLGPAPRAEGAVEAAVARVRTHEYPRRELAEKLVAFGRQIGADEAALAGARALADPGTVAVVGGQQPGLLTGPLYTIHKAATIVSLARSLSARTGGRFVPIFWCAGEDHDSAEIDHVWFPSAEGPIRIRAALEGAGRSVSDIALDFWDAFRSEVAAALDAGPFREPVLQALDAARSGSDDPATLFCRLMASCFAGTGLVLVEPRLLRPFCGEIAAQEIEEGGAQTNRLLDEAAGALRRVGYTPQLQKPDDALNVYLYENRRRSKLHPDGRTRIRVKVSGRETTRAELAALARSAPERFSTGVALRPVVQDRVLPTAVFVGGPGEVAYFAQLRGVHEHFAAPFPLVWPRAHVTLLEPEIAALATDAGIETALLFGGADAIDARLAAGAGRGVSGGRAASRMTSLLDDVVSKTEALAEIAAGVDPRLARTGRKIVEKTRRDLEKFRQKVREAEQRASGVDPAAARRIAAALTPRGGPQERTYNVVPFLARYGPALVSQIVESIDPLESGHQVLHLGSAS